MSLLKTGACFTSELELNCPTIVGCVTALPVGPAGVAGTTQVLGKDGQFHALPAASVPALSVSGSQLTITGGNTITLPDNDTQDLSISGNVISLTNGGSITLPTTAAPTPQVLSVSGDTLSLSGGGGSVTLPDTQDLSISGNVLSLTNGGSVTLPAATAPTLSISGSNLSISGGNTVALPAASVTFATPAETIVGTSTTLAVNPADLFARENIAAQTGVSNNLSAIPAPTASQSNWATNLLGETLHYEPGVGWKVVADNYGYNVRNTAPTFSVGAGPFTTTIHSFTAPRAGRFVATTYVAGLNSALQNYATSSLQANVFVNGVRFASALSRQNDQNGGHDANSAVVLQLAAGDIVTHRIVAYNIVLALETDVSGAYI
jgi:hypothetical protein